MRLRGFFLFVLLLGCATATKKQETGDADWDVVLVYAVNPMRVSNTPEATVAAIRSTLERRIDALSLARRFRVEAASPRVTVSLSGVSDLPRAKRLLIPSGKLDFEVVDDSSDILQKRKTALPAGISSRDERVRDAATSVTFLVAPHKDALQEFVRTHAPQLAAGRAIRFGPYDADPSASLRRRPLWRTYVVERSLEKRHMGIMGAEVRTNEMSGHPVVSVEFDKGTTEWFAQLTGNNVGRRLAITIDGEVNSVPTIMERISGGRAQLSMATSDSPERMLQEARELAVLLNLGALPVPIRLERETAK